MATSLMCSVYMVGFRLVYLDVHRTARNLIWFCVCNQRSNIQVLWDMADAPSRSYLTFGLGFPIWCETAIWWVLLWPLCSKCPKSCHVTFWTTKNTGLCYRIQYYDYGMQLDTILIFYNCWGVSCTSNRQDTVLQGECKWQEEWANFWF